MTIQQAAANNLSSRYQAQTETSRTDSGYPSVPPLAFASLVNAVAAAREGGQEWTRDEHIGEMAADCFRLSPPLMNWLNRETGLQLSAPPAGSPVTFTAMTGKADLTEHQAGMLAAKLEECFLFGLDQPAIDEPLDDAGQGAPDGLKPLEKQLITDRLAVLDEYDREKSNPTLYTRHALGDEWLKMKDVILTEHAGPLPEAAVENHVMAVPPAILYLVKEAQQGIRELEEGFRREWTGKLEEGVSDYLAGRVQATVEATGQALAESMTALRAAARPEMEEAALYAQQESGVLTLLAQEVMNLLGPGGVIKLLDKPAIKEMEKFLSSVEENKPGEEEKPETEQKLRGKMTEMLAGQLKAAAVKNPQLAKDLKDITGKAVQEYQKKNRTSLAQAACSLQHAIDKSARLRGSLKTAMNQQLRADAANLVATLEGSEKTLKKVFAEIEHFRPGVMENLNTLGTLAKQMINDGSLENHFLKKWQGMKNVPSLIGTAVNGFRKRADAALFGQINKPLPVSSDITLAQKNELSTLMIPLDNAADQIKSIARPLQSAAEKLQRVLNRDNKTAMDSDRLLQLSALKTRRPINDAEKNAGAVLGAALDTALRKDSGLVRLDEKVQKTQAAFSALTAEVSRTLPYLKEQLGEDLSAAVREMRQKFSGHPHATKYIQLAEGMVHAFSIRLDKLEKDVSEAVNADSKNLQHAAARMATGAKAIAGEAEALSQNIRLITAKELGAEYGYNNFEKNMVRNLIDLAGDLGNGEPEAEQKIVTQLAVMLSAADRTVLRRKHDPDNSVLIAGMQQELRNIHNDVRRRPPTVADLVAQTSPIKNQLLKSATKKSMTGVASVGMSALMGPGVVADITNGALNAMDVGSRVTRTTNILKAKAFYDSFKGGEGVRKATQPGDRRKDYESDKVLDRNLANVGLSALGLFLPGPVGLMTLPGAVYHAFKDPKDFMEALGGALPMELMAAGGARATILAATAAINAVEDRAPAGKNKAVDTQSDKLSALRQSEEKATTGRIAEIAEIQQAGAKSLDPELQADLAQQEGNKGVQDENEPKRASRSKRSFDYRLSAEEARGHDHVKRVNLLRKDKNLTPLQVESAINDYKSAVIKYRELIQKSAPRHELEIVKENLFKATDILEVVRNNLEEREKVRASLSSEQLNAQSEAYLKSIGNGYKIRTGGDLNSLQYTRDYLKDIIARYKDSERGGIDSPDTEITLIKRGTLKEEKFTLLEITTGRIDSDHYLLPYTFVEKSSTNLTFLRELRLLTATPEKEVFSIFDMDASGRKYLHSNGVGYPIENLGDQMLEKFLSRLEDLKSNAAAVTDMDNFYEANFKVTAKDLAKNPKFKAFREQLENFQYGKIEAQHLVLRGNTLSDVICFSIKDESGKDKILAMDINGSHIVIENTEEGLKNVENQKWIVSHLNGSKQYQYRDDRRKEGAFQYLRHSTAASDNLAATSSKSRQFSRPYSPLTTVQLQDTGKETFAVSCQRASDDMNAMIKTSNEYMYDTVIDILSVGVGAAVSILLASIGLTSTMLFMVSLAASGGMTTAKELLKALLKDNPQEVEETLRALPYAVLAGMVTDTGFTVGFKLAVKIAAMANISKMFDNIYRQAVRDYALAYASSDISTRLTNKILPDADKKDGKTPSQLKTVSAPELPETDVLDTSPKGVVIGDVYFAGKACTLQDVCRELGIDLPKFTALLLASGDSITDPMEIKAGTSLVIPAPMLAETRFSVREGETPPGNRTGNVYMINTLTNLNAVSRSLNMEPMQVFTLCVENGVADCNNIPAGTKLNIPDRLMQLYQKQVNDEDFPEEAHNGFRSGKSMWSKVKDNNGENNKNINSNNIPTTSDSVIAYFDQQVEESAVSNPNAAPLSAEFKTRFGQVKGTEFTIRKAAEERDIHDDLHLSIERHHSPAEKATRMRLFNELRVANPLLQTQDVIEAGTTLTLPEGVLRHLQQQVPQNSNPDTAPLPAEFKTRFGQVKDDQLTLLKAAGENDIHGDLYLSIESHHSPVDRMTRINLFDELREANPLLRTQDVIEAGTTLTLPKGVLRHFQQHVPQNSNPDAAPLPDEFKTRFGQVKGTEFTIQQAAEESNIRDDLHLSVDRSHSPAKRMKRLHLFDELRKANPLLQTQDVIEAGTTLILPKGVLQHFQQQTSQSSASNPEPTPQPLNLKSGQVIADKFNIQKSTTRLDIFDNLGLNLDSTVSRSDSAKRWDLRQQLIDANPCLKTQIRIAAGTQLTLPNEVLQYVLQRDS